jgi:hypothetical protein
MALALYLLTPPLVLTEGRYRVVQTLQPSMARPHHDIMSVRQVYRRLLSFRDMLMIDIN